MTRNLAIGLGLGLGLFAAASAVGAAAPQASPPPPAPPARSEAYTPAATIDARMATIGANGVAVLDVPSDPGIRFSSLRRDRDGEVEVHGLANEHIYILEGVLDYEAGGTVSGARATAPNEWRGGQIAGGRRYTLRPGDAMFIPAGTPHRIRLGEGVAHVRYIGVKNNSPQN